MVMTILMESMQSEFGKWSASRKRTGFTWQRDLEKLPAKLRKSCITLFLRTSCLKYQGSFKKKNDCSAKGKLYQNWISSYKYAKKNNKLCHALLCSLLCSSVCLVSYSRLRMLAQGTDSVIIKWSSCITIYRFKFNPV